MVWIVDEAKLSSPIFERDDARRPIAIVLVGGGDTILIASANATARNGVGTLSIIILAGTRIPART
jgi:NAD kinase